MSGRKIERQVLATNVLVDGVWYGPAHGNAADVPDDLVERITNPDVWVEEASPISTEPVAGLGEALVAAERTVNIGSGPAA